MEQLPFLSPDDFAGACDELLISMERIERVDFDIKIRDEGGQRYMTLRRPLQLNGSPAIKLEYTEAGERVNTFNQAPEDDEIDEVDEAALHHGRSVEQSAAVEYSILFSATYQVPVLYFGLYDLPPGSPRSIHAVYDHLVPEQWRPGLSSVGIMGGIGMTNHPITQVPCFFIHPCNTAEAMEELLQSRQISGLEYLQLWVGLIGGCVGLYLPKELALRSKEER